MKQNKTTTKNSNINKKKRYDLTSHSGQSNLGFYLGRTAQQWLRKKKYKKRHALFKLCLEKLYLEKSLYKKIRTTHKHFSNRILLIKQPRWSKFFTMMNSTKYNSPITEINITVGYRPK